MYKQRPKTPAIAKMLGDLNKDGKMSSWETARQNAIENSPANMMATPLKLKDACYRKAKAKYDVFPSAYASGYIAKCRKRGGKIK